MNEKAGKKGAAASNGASEGDTLTEAEGLDCAGEGEGLGVGGGVGLALALSLRDGETGGGADGLIDAEGEGLRLSEGETEMDGEADGL